MHCSEVTKITINLKEKCDSFYLHSESVRLASDADDRPENFSHTYIWVVFIEGVRISIFRIQNTQKPETPISHPQTTENENLKPNTAKIERKKQKRLKGKQTNYNSK